ncbi:MAG: Asp-tRNA(Asn)/Glu-tRNA(Gln) amidotransferase subunit GatA [Candidatus Saccharibacteria bacterium]|nr:Asp-tRNA(Asn)/Glu-tRNA(Gln) amidotransferase subunit GatA [Candidatus Saccharibacteria bacterium]
MISSLEDLVRQVKKQKLKPSQLVEEAINQIQLKSDLNIFIEIYENQARFQALQIEDKLNKGHPIGRLTGCIFVVKDNFLLKGSKTTAAAPILQNFEAPFTGTCLQKILDEDAILLGKTNLDAFAHGTSTENSYYKSTKNPHDSQRTPGGSSGGSAAALATDICHFSLGTDTGGSVRLPASFCGVVGYKPTYGLLSRYGLVAMASSTDCVAPFTKTPQDAKLLIEIMAGRDNLDATTLDSSNLDFRPKTVNQNLTLGVIKELNQNLDSDVQKTFNEALDHLRTNGWQIKEVSLPNIKLALACYYVLVSAEVSSNLSRYDGLRYGVHQSHDDWGELIKLNRHHGFMAENKRRIMLGTYVLSQGYYEAYYQKAQKLRTLLCQEFDQVFRQVEALLSPTSPTVAFKLGSKIDDPVQMYLADLMTVAPSLVGIPAISLPLKTAGLPVGLQLMTPQMTDNFNLNLAQELFNQLC